MKNDITPRQLQDRMRTGERLRLIDVRRPAEFSNGHIDGVENVPLNTISGDLPGVDPSETVVMICQGGVRSQTACGIVRSKYPAVLNLTGGMSAWSAAGLPIERAPKAPRSVERQSHFVGALLIWTAFILSYTVSPAWIGLAALPGFGLTLDALTGICPMSLILKRMPWNAQAA